MKNKKRVSLRKGLLLGMALLLSACLLMACGKEEPEEPQDSESVNQSDTVTESDSATEPTAKTLTYDLKSFKIIRPSGYDRQVNDAISTLCEKLAAIGVTEPEVSNDFELSEDPARKEILIGMTNQPASEEAKARLTLENEYEISFAENKIVVQVLDNHALSSAVDAFAEVLSTAKDGVLSVSEGDTVKGKADFEVVPIQRDGKLLYNVVLPGKATAEEQKFAITLMGHIKRYTGVEPELTYDDVTPYRADAYNILIGGTSYPETEQVLSQLGYDEYGVRAVGNKLVVAAHISRTFSKAGDLLTTNLLSNMRLDKNNFLIYVGNDWQGVEETYLLDFPVFRGGDYQMDIDDENGTLMFSYTGVKKDAFDSYYKEMEAMGYKLAQQNQIVDNLFRTYRGEKGEVHLSFYPGQSAGTLHIFSNRHQQTVSIPDADESYEKVTEATLHVMSLDYSHRTVYDGHGMNYVITLEDGRYIVMDGGYNAGSGSKDDERIYNYLVENNQRADGKVVIAAWFMSHPHGDHYGAFDSFVPKYKDQVTIEYFIANPYSPAMADGSSHWMLTKLPGLLYQTNAKLIKPHTGQIIKFCNTELEVLYTHENLYPIKMGDTNNSSTVIRLKQNGHTAIFTGDASTAACNKMVRLYGDALKSDMFQVNHHGYSGGTWALYDAATREDSYVLWTCSKEAFADRTYGELRATSIVYEGVLKANRDLALKVGFDRCFYADGVVEKITFPLGADIQISQERDVCVDPRS